MKYLVDTDVLADYLNGRPSATSLLTSFARDALAISLITYGEIYEGIYYGGNQEAHERGFLALLQQVPVLSLNKPILREFSRVRGQLRRSGTLIGDLDLLIAASALHHHLTLLTRNRSHFQRIPDLVLYE